MEEGHLPRILISSFDSEASSGALSFMEGLLKIVLSCFNLKAPVYLSIFPFKCAFVSVFVSCLSWEVVDRSSSNLVSFV